SNATRSPSKARTWPPTTGSGSTVLFFFSSRRRHTRWPRDWSSDVCSSDLPFVHIWEMHQVGLRVVDTNANVRLVEDFADLVADRVVDALDVELRRQSFLHAVDDRELGVALDRKSVV